MLAEDVEDVEANETRFAWLARKDAGAAAGHQTQAAPSFDARHGPFKTAVAFWPRESDHPGWLVDCLAEFSGRGVNMTRIESRPRKVGLGEYVFFVDVEGEAQDPRRRGGACRGQTHVAQLRVLGSFAAA